MPHGDADQGIRTPKSTFYDQGRFGRLFPTLPGFAADTPTVRAALVELGKPGGIMDTNESPTADPFALIVDPTLSAANPDNPRLTAGMTVLTITMTTAAVIRTIVGVAADIGKVILKVPDTLGDLYRYATWGALLAGGAWLWSQRKRP